MNIFLKAKILFLSLAVLTLGFAFLPTKVSAQAPFPFVFQYSPPVVTNPTIAPGQTATINVFTKNASNVSFSTPVCVTDFTTGAHLGCVPSVPYTPGSTFDFNVTREFDTSGTHVIGFSYQDLQGNWHGILNANERTTNASVFVTGQTTSQIGGQQTIDP